MPAHIQVIEVGPGINTYEEQRRLRAFQARARFLQGNGQCLAPRHIVGNGLDERPALAAILQPLLDLSTTVA
jgi:hypothetical protein